MVGRQRPSVETRRTIVCSVIADNLQKIVNKAYFSGKNLKKVCF